jgi:ABC-2 type transport system permease protein
VADALAHHALVYRRMVAARIRSEWQYRTAFLFTTVTQLLATSFGFVMVAALFTNVRELDGWSFADVALLYGMGSTAFSLADTCISQVEMATFHIRAGTFDRFLLRPASPIVQLCASEFAYRRLNKIVQALVVLATGIALVDVDWSPSHVVVLVASIVTGATIYGGLWVIYCSLSFWTVQTTELVYAAVTAGDVAGKYPFDVLRPPLRRLLTGVIPIAFVSYEPARWLLGRTESSATTLLAPPAVAIAVTALGALTWRTGIRRYQGTGS